MSNFNKEELLAKEEADIRSIAQELGIELKNNEEKEDIIYRILDEQAIRSINDRSSEPKKRTRIAATKKEAQKVVAIMTLVKSDIGKIIIIIIIIKKEKDLIRIMPYHIIKKRHMRNINRIIMI